MKPPLMALDARAQRRRWAALGAVAITILAGAYVVDRLWNANVDRPPTSSASTFVPLAIAGVRQPPTVAGQIAQIQGNAEVIGIAVAGRARAYLLSSFDPQPGGRHALHVVNDVIAGTPVTVTHCVRNDCTRVFTAKSASEPLQIGVGGWGGAFAPGLLLLVGTCRYDQRTGQPLAPGEAAFPYDKRDYVRTTWNDWLSIHPQSDLYIGSEQMSHGSLPPYVTVQFGE